jgi:hypothetical protein
VFESSNPSNILQEQQLSSPISRTVPVYNPSENKIFYGEDEN